MKVGGKGKRGRASQIKKGIKKKEWARDVKERATERKRKWWWNSETEKKGNPGEKDRGDEGMQGLEVKLDPGVEKDKMRAWWREVRGRTLLYSVRAVIIPKYTSLSFLLCAHSPSMFLSSMISHPLSSFYPHLSFRFIVSLTLSHHPMSFLAPLPHSSSMHNSSWDSSMTGMAIKNTWGRSAEPV